MRRNQFRIAVAAVIVAAAGYGVYQNHVKDEMMSDLVLANAEALAAFEGDNPGGGSSTSWPCWSKQKNGSGYWKCGNPCEWMDGVGADGPEGRCYKSN